MSRIKALGGIYILDDSDLPSLSAAALRVEKLMLDGEWHSATEILQTAGQREGLRRLRELRTRFQIDRERSTVGREFYYRLVKPADGAQGRLFPTGQRTYA